MRFVLISMRLVFQLSVFLDIHFSYSYYRIIILIIIYSSESFSFQC